MFIEKNIPVSTNKTNIYIVVSNLRKSAFPFSQLTKTKHRSVRTGSKTEDSLLFIFIRICTHLCYAALVRDVQTHSSLYVSCKKIFILKLCFSGSI